MRSVWMQSVGAGCPAFPAPDRGLHQDQNTVGRWKGTARSAVENPLAISDDETESLPDVLMPGVLWSFVGDTHLTRDGFVTAIQDHERQVRGAVSWQPDRIVFRAPRIAVQYMCWDGDDQIEPLVELASDNGEYFTAAELLFKVHNAVVVQLRDIDHHFFESFEFSGVRESDGVAEYTLQQGS